MSRNKKLPVFKEVEIKDIGSDGKALSRIEGMVVFVKDTLPGDVVDIQVKKKRKKYMEGIPVTFHSYSSLRVEAFCGHFGVCGGCKWQDLRYEEQLRYKEKQVVDNILRIGKQSDFNILPILPSQKTKYYRNKLEYTFSNSRWLTGEEINTMEEIEERRALGFHIPGMFDKILDIKNCHLQPDPSNAIRNFVKEFALKNGYSFFDLRKQEGYLRTLIIRTASTGELMLILSVFYDDEELLQNILNAIVEAFPGINSLMYVVNKKANDTILDQEIILFHGRDHIIEKMEDLKFKVGPKSFYQTNSDQAFELYKIVKEFAGLTGTETIYDLYSGTGTIAIFLSRWAKKVVAVESVPEAVEDARENAILNGMSNIDFHAGDVKDVLNSIFFDEHGNPDLIVFDPPRAGIHKDVLQEILKTKIEKIIYVSCNPATQARDIEILSDKYTLLKIQPVDMFPHTTHVENVALLGRKMI